MRNPGCATTDTIRERATTPNVCTVTAVLKHSFEVEKEVLGTLQPDPSDDVDDLGLIKCAVGVVITVTSIRVRVRATVSWAQGSEGLK